MKKHLRESFPDGVRDDYLSQLEAAQHLVVVVVNRLTDMMADRGTPVRVDVEIEGKKCFREVIIWTGRNTETIRMSLGSKLVRIKNVPIYLKTIEAAPMLLDELIRHAELAVVRVGDFDERDILAAE